MQGQVRFDRDLHRFLSMVVQIWPSLNLGMKHLSEVGRPLEGSFLPIKPYNTMSHQQFQSTIVQGLFDFIMNHQVSAQLIEDYLLDVLDLLMVEEELVGGSNNPSSAIHMARRTMRVIEELQEGKNKELVEFQEEIYNNVKGMRGEVVEQKEEEGVSEEWRSEGSSYSEQDGEESEEEVREESEEEKRLKEEERRREEELQDDGWVIVRKK